MRSDAARRSRAELLERNWARVPEEDGEGEMVFRPAGHALPPARGRVTLDLRAGGRLVEGQPGPADVPESAEGSWELQGDDLVLERRRAGRTVLHIRALEEDRLVVES